MSIRNWVFLTHILCFSLRFYTAKSWICFKHGNFTENSTYSRNRDRVLSSLISNTPRNGNFFTVSIGEDPDKVYGLALCRGDASSESCSGCVEKSRQVLTKQCPNQKEVVGWERIPPCIVHYANRSFYGILELTPTVPVLYNGNYLTSNLTQFDETWEGLMDDLATRAAVGASRLKFAVGEKQLTSSQTIYALMQCTPDLSRSDCGVCLRQTVSDYRECCLGRQGGYVRRISCDMRWEVYPFYASLPSPPSSPPDSNSTNPPATEEKGVPTRTIIIVAVSISGFMAVVALTCAFLRRRLKRKHGFDGIDESDVEEIIRAESLQFDFGTVRIATNNFSNNNKLGQGGFGIVYMGKLQDGQDIAVKRLSKNSGQGELEFKNEIVVMARLQHRHLVRLFGFCLEGNERLLIYEFVPNSSLDCFLFDPSKRLLLDWDARYKIIVGIARGLLYLHEDSQYRIIHRDLKAANILLDADMNPKISDFGMARLFAGDQSQAATRRIVGTYGYMAPEYVMNGKFSVKSDVYSFGVLVLEIISGQKIYFNNGEEGENLLSYAWKNWMEGTVLTNLIDPILRDSSRIEIMRCIHLGLLCVQENVARRPTMASVVVMLSSNSVSFPAPTKPAFLLNSFAEADQAPARSRWKHAEFSMNDANISDLEPR